MKPKAAKAKGRAMCQKLRDEIILTFPDLEPDDVRITSSGAMGEDLQLSPAARRRMPFAIECKNTESLNIWNAINQARSHAKGTSHVPMVAFTRNRETPFAAVPMQFLIELLGIRWASMQAVRNRKNPLPFEPEVGQTE